MDDFEKILQEELKNPEFEREWNAIQPEYQILRAIIAARIDAGLTQAELAKRCGMRQSNISRIENGDCIPNLKTLEKIANGLNKNLKIEFV